MANIGIRLASGEFYPILEESGAGAKRLVVTTVQDNQTSVHIDLFREATGETSETFVGSLVIEAISRGRKGDPDIELDLSLDSEGNLTAAAVDKASGAGSSLSVSLDDVSAPGDSLQDYSFDEFTDKSLPDIKDMDSGDTADVPDISGSFGEALDLPDIESADLSGDLTDDEATLSDDDATLSDELSLEENDDSPLVAESEDFSVPESMDDFSVPEEGADSSDFSLPQEDDESPVAESTDEPAMSQMELAESMDLPPLEDFTLDDDLDPSLLAKAEQARKEDESIDFSFEEGPSSTLTEMATQGPESFEVGEADDFSVPESTESFDIPESTESFESNAEEPELDLDDDILTTGPDTSKPRNEYKPFKTEKQKRSSSSPLVLILGILAGVIVLLICALLVYQCTRAGTAPATENEKGAQTVQAEKKPEPMQPVEVKPAETKPAVTETKPEAVKPAETKPQPVKPAATKAVSAKKPGVWYKIKWGDTLWDLANAYYRNPWLWKKIWKGNKIKNPDLIISGRWIWIPPK